MSQQIETRRRSSLARSAALALLAMLTSLGGASATAQETRPGAGQGVRSGSSEIQDKAGLFGAGAIETARRELDRVERETGAAIIIETIDSLKGESADEAAVSLARRSGIQGFFILIARKERKLEVLASRTYREILTDARRQSIRNAFFEGFHRQDFNEGLRRGVAALGEALAAVRRPAEPLRAVAGGASTLQPSRALPGYPTGGQTPTSSGPGTDSGLVRRNQVRLTLAGARAILAGAEAKAQSMGLKVNMAVVDDGGHLLAFERMDGARPASGYTAITKATTAATFRQPTGPLPAGTTSPDPLLNLSLQNAAMASGGKITTLYGGVPVVVEGQVIGGVGVGGGSGEQDAQVARAGIQGFLDQLAAPQAGAKEKSPSGDSPRPGERDGASKKREDSSF
jgi:glc operon protein GlcG